jgi:hypothetical protein
MKKKMQIVSNLNGQITGTGVQEILDDDGKSGPTGCSILAGDGERIDLVELTPKVAKLSASEMFRRGSMRGTKLHVSAEVVAKEKSGRKR